MLGIILCITIDNYYCLSIKNYSVHGKSLLQKCYIQTLELEYSAREKQQLMYSVQLKCLCPVELCKS